MRNLKSKWDRLNKMNIEYKENIDMDIADLLALYEDAGWKNYTGDPERLGRAFAGSAYTAAVFDRDMLVGALRAVSDGETIVYIQDLLVLAAYQRMGIGGKLMDMVLDKYKNVRQKVLLTDETDNTLAFYASKGFNKSTDIGTVSFVRID